ncbi:MAG: HAD-IIA family hydrolase [Monoglobaceae bacterium]
MENSNTEALKQCRLFLFDMDGTIYLDNDLFDGTLELLDYIRSVGGRYIFMTNNSSKSVDKYIEKLAGMGISASAEDFVTSVNATEPYLAEKGYKKIYALGTASFREQLREAGLSVTETPDDDVDCLCMGYDTELTYKKLWDACVLLGRGIDYVATNPDWVCPTSFGYVPDCGSVSEMLYRATGRKPIFIGKPEPAMAELAMRKTGIGRDKTVILGDRLYTDIACGVNAGINTVFMLSGEGTMEDVEKSAVKPKYIFDNVAQLYRVLSDNRPPQTEL